MTLDIPAQPRRTTKALQQKRLWLEVAIVAAVALFLIVVLPLMLSGFRLGLVGRYLALAIVALGIDLIWGFTGLLSLGHGIFFALGGYAFAIYLTLVSLPQGQLPEFFSLYGVSSLPWFWKPFYSLPFTILAMVVIPAIVAALFGYLVFRNRIRGVYFSILTQAALVVFFNFFNGQQKLINGTNGLKTDTSLFLGKEVGTPDMQSFFYVVTIIALVAAYALCRWLTSGRFGRMLVAIRDDENRVRFSGYNPATFKVLVFAVSGAIAGVSGALYTVQSGIISPQAMDIAFSIEMVIWVAVGGRATLIGAIFGALLVNMARSLLSERFPAVWLFFQGALFLLVVTALPDGIVGWVRSQFGSRLPAIFRKPELTPAYVADMELEAEIYRDKEKELADN